MSISLVQIPYRNKFWYNSADDCVVISFEYAYMKNPAPHYLKCLSPLDGRYANKIQALTPYFSEFALIYYRLKVELAWFLSLAEQATIAEILPLNKETQIYIEKIADDFNLQDAEKIKEIEQTTNHDVKAVEYYIKEKFLAHPTLASYVNFIHFACTSEDINNLAYALMLKDALSNTILPAVTVLKNTITQLGKLLSNTPMLARTHGQPATPTTLGKELINFSARLDSPIRALERLKPMGKCNGAVGNYNAHIIAYPDIDWPRHCQAWVESLGLEFNAYTTQIEPHDILAEYAHILIRINNIFLDYAKDIWTYISLGYFKQKIIANEVGSSTMPHKVNPIDFENAEGNLGLANALLNYFANKLTQSRLQRDLSDSTVLRNLGSALGYALVAWQSLEKGNLKLEINPIKLQDDLNENWEVLAEALQTIMRRYHIQNAYEKIKELTRGVAMDAARFHHFIAASELPKEVKQRLLLLSPEKYTGLAAKLAQEYA